MQYTTGRTTQVFGANKHFAWQLGTGHLGKDWGVAVGTDCVAIAPGTVLWAGWGHQMPAALCAAYHFITGSTASGICVLIQHDGWLSLYAHLDSTHLYSKSLLHKASVVRRGQVVGKSGNTGNSTGPHLHGEAMVSNPPATPPYGRYNPDLQIAHEDRVAAAQAAALKVAPHQRIVAPGDVNELDRPGVKGARVLRTFKAGETLNFKGYVLGERINGLNGWLVGVSGKYFHIGRFTQKDVRGLVNLTPKAPAPTPPAPKPAPAPVKGNPVPVPVPAPAPVPAPVPAPAPAPAREAEPVPAAPVTVDAAHRETLQNFTNYLIHSYLERK